MAEAKGVGRKLRILTLYADLNDVACSNKGENEIGNPTSNKFCDSSYVPTLPSGTDRRVCYSMDF